MAKYIDTLLLRSFVTAVKCGTVVAAARALDLTQPGVSKHVRRLEDVVGKQLLDRSARGVRLTSAGEKFLGYAQKMLAINDEALSSFRPALNTRAIRVGMIENFAASTHAKAFTGMLCSHSSMNFEVSVCNSLELQVCMNNDEIDVAILDPRYLTPFVVYEKQCPLGWYASPDFDVTLRPLPIVALPESYLWRNPALMALSQAGISWEIVMQSASLTAIRTAVEAGAGIGCFMQSAAGSSLVQIQDDLPLAPVMTLGVAVNPASAACPTVERAVSLLKELL